jgi:hypothetical protein
MTARTIADLDGLFVGQLNEEEMDLFRAAVKRREARRSFEGVAGLMGLARVRCMREVPRGED